jgi:membrane protein
MESILRKQDGAGAAEQERIGARRLLGDVVRGLVRDHSFHYAAGAAFRVTLAVFPLVVGLVAVLALTGSGHRADTVIETISRTGMVPDRTVDAMRAQLDELDEPGPNLVFGAIAAFALAIWSSAAAFRTVMSGLNRAFEMQDRTRIFGRFGVSLALAAVTATLATIATFLVAEGPVVESFFESLPGGSGPLVHLWDLLRFPAIAVLVFAWLSITYAWGPADRREFRFVTPGIIIAFLIWLAFALVFSWYVDDVSNQGRLYGSFTGLIAFQLYMYWSALIIFVGAQVDNAIGTRGS